MNVGSIIPGYGSHNEGALNSNPLSNSPPDSHVGWFTNQQSDTSSNVVTPLFPSAQNASNRQGGLAPSPPSYPHEIVNVSAYFNSIKNNQFMLNEFLRNFPLGGDIHSHIAGAVGVNAYVAYAIQNGFYYDPETLFFYKEKEERQERQPAVGIVSDFNIQKEIKKKFTMAGCQDNPNKGCQHFFNSFPCFESIQEHMPLSKLIEPVLVGCHEQRILYTEQSKEFKCEELSSDFKGSFSLDEMEQAYKKIIPSINDIMKRHMDYINEGDRTVSDDLTQLGFFSPISSLRNPVVIRFICDVCRIQEPADFFADMLLAMTLCKEDFRIVGVTISGPEDHLKAMHERTNQLKIIDFLWKKFKKEEKTVIKMAIHAGEIDVKGASQDYPGNIIKNAIEEGHASRIGHGVSLKKEDMINLLKTMKQKGICIEICLTSNEYILGIKDDDHPFKIYFNNQILTTLNTDDKGVTGSDLRNEFAKAIERYRLSYEDVERLARSSIQASFVNKDSKYGGIYVSDNFELRPEFRGAIEEADWKPSEEANNLLEFSPKAVLQLRLEKQLYMFRNHTVPTMYAGVTQLKYNPNIP